MTFFRRPALACFAAAAAPLAFAAAAVGCLRLMERTICGPGRSLSASWRAAHSPFATHSTTRAKIGA